MESSMQGLCWIKSPLHPLCIPGHECTKGGLSWISKTRVAQMHGPKNWSLIAGGIRGRSGKSCRLRWCNQLDPGVNKEPFSEWEDAVIINAHIVRPACKTTYCTPPHVLPLACMLSPSQDLLFCSCHFFPLQLLGSIPDAWSTSSLQSMKSLQLALVLGSS